MLMFNCREVAQRSGEYLEGDLSAWKRLKMAVHLLMCGDCRRFVRHVRLSLAYFEKLLPRPVSPEDAGRIAELAVEKACGGDPG